MAQQIDEKFKAKFADLVKRNYKGQACWFLNGFWNDLEKDAEIFWKYVKSAEELDKRGKDGNELDEFEAHRFLEALGEVLTVQEMRKKLREIDLDFNGKMAITEFLIFKYEKTVQAVVNAPQGGENKEEMIKAAAMVEAAQTAVNAAVAALEAEKVALAAQKAAEEATRAAKAQADAAEAEALAAEEEQRTALAELHAQEKALADEIASLEIKSNEGGVVSRGKAKQELEQLKAQDPLPLRRAKINQEATVRKLEKARKRAEEESAKAAHALRLQEDATREAEGKTAAAAATVAEAEKAQQDALDYLEEVKSRPGQSYGDIWWMEREIEDMRRFLPMSRGGRAK